MIATSLLRSTAARRVATRSASTFASSSSASSSTSKTVVGLLGAAGLLAAHASMDGRDEREVSGICTSRSNCYLFHFDYSSHLVLYHLSLSFFHHHHYVDIVPLDVLDRVQTNQQNTPKPML